MIIRETTSSIRAIRLEKFMGFEDTDWMELKPITLLFGRNSSGKSALLRALLMLKQSLGSKSRYGPLVFADENGIDIGNYQNWIHKHQVEYDAVFGFEVQVEGNEISKFPWVGNYGIVSPWARARLRFGLASKNKIILKELRLEAEVKIWDGILEEESIRLLNVFSATRPHNKSNQWWFRSDIIDEKFDEGEWPAVYLDSQQGFWPFLQIRESLKKQYQQSLLNEKYQQSNNQSFNFISGLVSRLGSKVCTFLQSLEHIGPIRSEPKRFYYVPQFDEAGVGKQGQHFVQSFLSAPERLDNFISIIDDALHRSGIPSRVQISALDKRKTLYSVDLVEHIPEENSDLNINLMDVGFGVSQSLPVLLASLMAGTQKTLLIEQPELHLHPRAQAEFANIFVSLARQGSYFIIETHSEHFFLRLRRWIAEYENKRYDQLSNENIYLPLKELAAYFINRKDGVSYANALEINSQGDVESPPEGYANFFSDDYLETLALARLSYPHDDAWSKP
jgi:predicted ATPase